MELVSEEIKDWLSMPKTYSINTNRYPTFYSPVFELDSNFSECDYIYGLKTNLYNHQKKIVKAMVDLEKGEQTIKISLLYNTQYTGTYQLFTNAGILSEPVGSGKTIDILALILLQKIPIQKSNYIELPLGETKGQKLCRGIAKITYKKYMTPTVIFVGVGVLNQWYKTILNFTNLKIYYISNVRELQNLIDATYSGVINNYDIVLVKNGTVTNNLVFPSHIKITQNNKIIKPYIYNIIANLNVVWARVVIDEIFTAK